jgi:hypothetical protein
VVGNASLIVTGISPQAEGSPAVSFQFARDAPFPAAFARPHGTNQRVVTFLAPSGRKWQFPSAKARSPTVQ